MSRTVKVRNGSPVAVDLDLSPAAEALAKLNVDISPAGSVVVRGKETLDLTLIFRPPVRQRPFTHAVEAVASGHRMMLFQLSGACLGTEVKLASDSIPFGAVVIGSMITKRLQLENTGDVGTKFTWDTGAFGKHFRISPTSGFIAAGQVRPRERSGCMRHPRVHATVTASRIRARGLLQLEEVSVTYLQEARPGTIAQGEHQVDGYERGGWVASMVVVGSEYGSSG